MAKRWLALILGLLMLLPPTAWAEQSAGMRLQVSPHTLRFTYTNPAQQFVLVEYRTTNDSGKLVVYSDEGVFSGEFNLPAAFEREALYVTVSTLSGTVLGRYETATYPTSYPPAAENLPQAESKASRLSAYYFSYDEEGLHYSFYAPGHTQLWLRCRSGQEMHEVPIFPDESWHFDGTLPMNCTYNDAYMFVRVSAANKNTVLYESAEIDT